MVSEEGVFLYLQTGVTTPPSCVGLFLCDESIQQHWINPSSLESDSEYQLIGLLLGLAIYNNIILDIRFPLVIYRKLLGCPVDLTDLYSSHPVIIPVCLLVKSVHADRFP